MRSKASSFKWQYPLLSLRSSISFLRLLPRLLVTSVSPFIFPSITCFRRQFLRKMWPIQLAFRFRISRRIFLCSLMVVLHHTNLTQARIVNCSPKWVDKRTRRTMTGGQGYQLACNRTAGSISPAQNTLVVIYNIKLALQTTAITHSTEVFLSFYLSNIVYHFQSARFSYWRNHLYRQPTLYFSDKIKTSPKVKCSSPLTIHKRSHTFVSSTTYG